VGGAKPETLLPISYWKEASEDEEATATFAYYCAEPGVKFQVKCALLRPPPDGVAYGARIYVDRGEPDTVFELRALPELAPSTSRSYDTASTRRLPSARRKREQREKGRGKRAHAAPACGSVAGVSLARRMTGDAPVPTAAFVPPAPPVQSPKSGLAARLARVSDDILLTEAALDAAASTHQPLSPSALHCQVVDKHERLERRKAAR